MEALLAQSFIALHVFQLHDDGGAANVRPAICVCCTPSAFAQACWNTALAAAPNADGALLVTVRLYCTGCGIGATNEGGVNVVIPALAAAAAMALAKLVMNVVTPGALATATA